MTTNFTTKENRMTRTTEERRTIRREYINYFLQNPDKKMDYPLLLAVRMMEIVKVGATLQNYYRHIPA